MAEEFLTLRCQNCGKTKNKNDFAKTPFLKENSGRELYCRTCKKKLIKSKDDLKDYFKQHNIFFDEQAYKTAYNYVKNKQLKKYKNGDFPSDFESHFFNAIVGRLFSLINLSGSFKALPISKNNNKKSSINEVKELDREIIVKWGEGYSKDEYIKLEKFYQDMFISHEISTPQHKELLKFMCILNLKMHNCLEQNDIGGFSKLHEQYQKILQSSGFRPIDKTAADGGHGIRTFSQIFAEVEKNGFIKPIPVEENQDIVDKTIMYMLNYQLKLLNMQQLIEPPLDTPKVGDES